MDSTTSDFKFDWVEYSVVAAMLLLSVIIGAYYTFIKKQVTLDDYMLGGRSMGAFPVAMSIVASYVSGITVVGMPAEAYLYGTQHYIVFSAVTTAALISVLFYLPVFHKLQLNSVFEYLELRFNRNLRLLGMFLYSMSLIFFLPLAIYVPALTFSQDVSVHITAPVITAFCLLYTVSGGLKAVVWTDTIQNMFTLFAVLFVVILGCQRLGGVEEILRINEEGTRLEAFNMDPNPFVRISFWSAYLGSVFLYASHLGVNPGSVQRYLAVPTLRTARMSLLISAIGFTVIMSLVYSLGIVIFARYHNCDPVATRLIKSHNQIVPLYVMEIGRDYPGLAGLFVSGVMSAALSTISSWLNTVGGTLYSDVKEMFFPEVRHSELTGSRIIKVIIITLGAVCTALVLVVERLGPILQMSFVVYGIVYGSILYLFSLGLFFPRANVKGAVAGTVASLAVSSWIIFGAQYYVLTGKLSYPGKATSVDECSSELFQRYNTSSAELFTYKGVGSPVVVDSSVPLVYQISFHYYLMIGTVSGLVVGVLVSLFTEPPDYSALSPDLFSACVHRFLPRSMFLARPAKEEYKLASQTENFKVIEKC